MGPPNAAKSKQEHVTVELLKWTVNMTVAFGAHYNLAAAIAAEQIRLVPHIRPYAEIWAALAAFSATLHALQARLT